MIDIARNSSFFVFLTKDCVTLREMKESGNIWRVVDDGNGRRRSWSRAREFVRASESVTVVLAANKAPGSLNLAF